jgi:hypothetical protein
MVDPIVTINSEITEELFQENINSSSEIITHPENVSIPNTIVVFQNNDSCFIRSNLTGIYDIIISTSQLHISQYLDNCIQEGKYLSNQINPLPESDIFAEENNGEMVLETQVQVPNDNDHSENRETFIFICSNSHFSLYPDLFADRNFFDNQLIVPLHIDDFLQNRGTVISQTIIDLSCMIIRVRNH